ncbi:MAG: hypothetical protein IAF38_06310, partial [Bacteroidia bacterium]|nr:hypothetical protein [Bacteroidia bacterium]
MKKIKFALFYVMLSFCIISNSQTVNSVPTSGNVGMGTMTPAVKLEVVGDTKLGGGMTVDSAVIMKDSLTVVGDSKLKDVLIDGNVDITGNAKVSGTLILKDQFNFSTDYSVKYIPTVGTQPSYTLFGPVDPIVVPTPGGPTPGPGPAPNLPWCWPQINNVNAFNGMMVGYKITSQNTVGAINMGFDGAHSIIEAMSNDGDQSAAGLLMNWYCGRDIYMCTGAAGGVVSAGKNFEVGLPTRDVTVATNIKATDLVAMQITNSFTTDGNYSIKNIVNRNLTKAFAVLNNSSGLPFETFTVNGNGSTSIQLPSGTIVGTKAFISGYDLSGQFLETFSVKKEGLTEINIYSSVPTNAFKIFDFYSQKVNFEIKSNGYVWARRFEVTMNNFPDYVFNTSYKKKTLYEVETFINVNGHLENMPTAEEVEKTGADLGEISRVNVEKTEEIFL